VKTDVKFKTPGVPLKIAKENGITA